MFYLSNLWFWCKALIIITVLENHRLQFISWLSLLLLMSSMLQDQIALKCLYDFPCDFKLDKKSNWQRWSCKNLSWIVNVVTLYILFLFIIWYEMNHIRKFSISNYYSSNSFAQKRRKKITVNQKEQFVCSQQDIRDSLNKSTKKSDRNTQRKYEKTTE